MAIENTSTLLDPTYFAARNVKYIPSKSNKIHIKLKTGGFRIEGFDADTKVSITKLIEPSLRTLANNICY